MKIETDVCLGSISFYSYTYSELVKLSQLYPYVADLATSIKDHPHRGRDFRFSAEIDPQNPPGGKFKNSKSKRKNSESKWKNSDVSEYLKYTQHQIRQIQECAKSKASRLRISISQTVFESSEATSKIGFRSDETQSSHHNQVIIDLKTQTGFIVDSSGGRRGVLYAILSASLEIFLEHYLGLPIKISKAPECMIVQKYKLQGDSDLCSVWTTLLFLVYLLNPGLSLDQIYTILGRQTQETRNRYILQYLYYVWTQLKFIKLPYFDSEQIQDLKNDRLPELK